MPSHGGLVRTYGAKGKTTMKLRQTITHVEHKAAECVRSRFSGVEIISVLSDKILNAHFR